MDARTSTPFMLRSLSGPWISTATLERFSSLPLLFVSGRFATFLFTQQKGHRKVAFFVAGPVPKGPLGGAAGAQAAGRVSAKLGRCMSLSSSLPRFGYSLRQAICGKRKSSQPRAQPTAMSDRLMWMPLQ